MVQVVYFLPVALAALKRLDPSRYSFTADVGDSWFIALELPLRSCWPPVITPRWALPGRAGRWERESSSPRGGHSRLGGDGAFQMTGTELATMNEQGLAPIVLLLNSSSYGMLEAIDRPRNYHFSAGLERRLRESGLFHRDFDP